MPQTEASDGRRPGRARRAPANSASSISMSSRMDAEVFADMDAAVRHLGITQRAFLEGAINREIRRLVRAGRIIRKGAADGG